MLSEGDLVEYCLAPGNFGYHDRVGMLGLVVKMDTPRVFCQVLWVPFAHHGPQWYKIENLRSLEALGEGGSSGGR